MNVWPEEKILEAFIRDSDTKTIAYNERIKGVIPRLCEKNELSYSVEITAPAVNDKTILELNGAQGYIDSVSAESVKGGWNHEETCGIRLRIIADGKEALNFYAKEERQPQGGTARTKIIGNTDLDALYGSSLKNQSHVQTVTGSAGQDLVVTSNMPVVFHDSLRIIVSHDATVKNDAASISNLVYANVIYGVVSMGG